MLPSWLAGYIGIPFQDRGRTRGGLDCYGLIVLVFADQFGITLPSFSYGSANDRVAVARIFFEEARSARWRRVDLKDAQPPDVLAMSLAGMRHVGVLVAPGRFLHVLAGRETCVERIHPLWTPRIDAVYRHEELALVSAR